MNNLPSGTVTFLFTDIEESTTLAREHPIEWEIAQQRHHAILREACESHGGYVFKIIGDAFHVAFSTAEAGLQSAITAQRTLQAEAWGITPIRVRMGLHTGTAEITGGEYHGYMTLAQAARVMSTAHGNQMLISNASYALVASHLPQGVELRDMGEHRLKGLLNPERLWQVDVPGLQQNFPPLQSLNAIPSNLPIQLTSFVGREHELSELHQIMLTTRLLTLIGSGGVGKTRLALELAAQLLDQFTEGVWLFELASLSQPERVSQTIATTLGLRDYAGRTIQESVLDYLSGKKCLLILDNCEHLIGACAQLADAILHRASGVNVIATSREALEIAGELAWRVPSLAVPEPKQPIEMEQLESYPGVRLFVDRAAFAAPGFRVDTKNADVVRQICYRLDGIPLAIELAAARVRLLSVAQIAERLDDRFHLLTGGSRTAVQRQQTLRALIDWSYDLLPEDERRLLRYLSVFAGGCSLEAAEAVGEGFDVLGLLTQLVNKSLVNVIERAGQHRYAMLESVRQYATEKLIEHGESDLVHKRMAAYLMSHGQAFGRRVDNWLQIEAELDNVRALVGWARMQPDPTTNLHLVITLGSQYTWDYLAEPLIWLDDALARGVRAPANLRLAALSTQLGLLYFSGYNLSDWATQIEAYLSLAEQVDDDELKMGALFWAGLVAWDLQEYDRVNELHARGLEIAQLMSHQGDKQGIANFSWGLGLVQMKRGNPEGAATYFHQSLQAGRDSNNGSAMHLGLSGYTWTNPRAALLLGAQEVAQLRAKGHRDPLIRVLQSYTQPLILLGQYAQAETALQECLVHWHRLGVRWDATLGSAQTLFDLGQVAWLHNDPDKARAWYEQSLDEYSQVGDKERIARLHVYIGLTHLARGELDDASNDLQIGFNLYRELKRPSGISLALTSYARLAEAHGQMELAARLFGAASVPQGILDISNLWPASSVIYKREIAEARKRFAKKAWMRYWHEGENMLHEQAMAIVGAEIA